MTSDRPSRTATKIARFILLLDSVPRLKGVLPMGSAAAAEAILLGSRAVPERAIRAMRSPRTVRLYEVAEAVLGRGQLLWFGVRKRWMYEAVERSVAEGARQLLVVGAGFDPLAAMIARRHPEVLSVEIDAPRTADPKRLGVERADLARSNHLVLAADLASTPLEEALRTTPWRRDVKSIVVAEGVLMYLRGEDVAGFFRQVRRCTSAGSRVAFSSVDADPHGRPRVIAGNGWFNRLVQATLRAAGEPMHWGLSPSAVPEFLGAAEHRPLEQPTPPSLRARFLDPLGLHDEPLAPYEHLTLAESLP